MRAADLLQSESSRLRTLHEYEILDTPPEARFDSLVRVAATVFNVPISAVSLVDANRQWFKAKVGLGACETGRDIAFCAHAVQQEKLLVVPDAKLDERFHDNPLVVGAPHIRFYAGAPLRSPDGYVLGTLCVLAPEARNPTGEQLEALTDLASQVVDQLELRRVAHQASGVLKVRSQELANSELEHAFLSGLVNNLTCGVIAEDSERRVILANNALLRLFDIAIAPEKLIGSEAVSVQRLIQSQLVDAKSFEQAMTQFYGERTSILQKEIALKGDRFCFCDFLYVDLLHGRKGRMLIFYDITRQRNAEKTVQAHRAQIAESAKLAALGEMAGGIAHEINNPLALVEIKLGLLQKLISNGSTIEEVQPHLEKMSQVIQRISGIVRGLKKFARDGGGDSLETVKVADILQDALSFCEGKLRNHAIEVRISPILPSLAVHCRPVQFSQVLMNLIHNAFDAVKDTKSPWIALSASAVGNNVEIEITDSGNGIPAQVAEKMFQPFFTTKPVGVGTGLGLSISKGMLESQGGSLRYDPSRQNTTFVLTLPARS